MKFDNQISNDNYRKIKKNGAVVFSDWVCIVRIVMSFFFYSTSGSIKGLMNCLYCWNVFFCSVPLENLYWTGLYTGSICYARIPIYCDHCSANADLFHFFAIFLVCSKNIWVL